MTGRAWQAAVVRRSRRRGIARDSFLAVTDGSWLPYASHYVHIFMLQITIYAGTMAFPAFRVSVIPLCRASPIEMVGSIHFSLVVRDDSKKLIRHRYITLAIKDLNHSIQYYYQAPQ